jgi:hypothetical protein
MIEIVEYVPCGPQAYLVRRHESPQRMRIIPDEPDDRPVTPKIVVHLYIDPIYLAIPKRQILGPSRKDAHNHGLRRRNADEIHGRFLGWFGEKNAHC